MTEKEQTYWQPEENQMHKRMKNKIEEILKEEENGLSTKELSEKIESEGIATQKTARSLLYYARKNMIEDKNVITDKDNKTTGDDGWIWRFDG